MNYEDREKVYTNALMRFGEEHQMVVAIEEMSELQKELTKLLRDEREGYETFWKNFGRQIKYGVMNEFGRHKDLLQDLLLFWSSKESKLVTLKEYTEAMPEEQKCIYFASGESRKLTHFTAPRFPPQTLRWFASEAESFFGKARVSHIKK